MQAADSDGVLYKQLELETEIQKKIKIEIGRCASYWKQIEVQSLWHTLGFLSLNWLLNIRKNFEFTLLFGLVFFDLNYFMKIRQTNFNFKLFFFQYDDESAVWAYTFGKSVYDYACMYMVMMEIKSRLPPNKFQPRTILDFGSGVGTSIWWV